MDNVKEYLSKINNDTSEIKIEDIQDVMKTMGKMRTLFGCSNEYMEYCHEILKILWHHMETGFAEFDHQLLCSTCFYAILLYSNDQKYYLVKVLEYLTNELDLKEKAAEPSNSLSITISLAYGIFQSSILQQNIEHSTLEVILEKIFTLLTLIAYEYSQYTFITFKILTFFKKVVGTVYQNVIFNKDHNFKILNIINHNWENPITGVRSLNKIIFQNLISVVDKSLYEHIEHSLNSFYWNKAKYLMLAEVIEISQGNIKVLLDKYNMVQGLIYSLNKAGLVSAGADMYVNILKKLTTEKEWCTIFLPSIIKLLNDSCIKPIENFNNYWCLNTLKKFSSLSQIFFDEINKLDDSDHKLYGSLCIMHQSNRLGLLENHFISYDQVEKLVLNSIDHSDVHIRMVAFNIMCSLHNKLRPIEKNYNLIIDFLKNNVNSDCSILRISMIKSFENFLVQLHMIFLNKSNECNIENLITFCKELQIFIIDSLNFDGNYQRKIATIQIIKVMLTNLKVIPRKKQKGAQKFKTNLFDFIKSRNQWILSEKQVILKLISLLKDPADDIRELVKDVLLYNYTQELCDSEMITNLTEEALSCMKSRFFYQITCGQTIFKLILCLLLTQNCTEGRFKKVEDVFDFAHNEIKSECTLNFDILKSIIEGKQLHSYLNILYSIFEVSIEKSYELNISIHVIHSLIELLKNISNQFAWDQETLVSSDFSKMNDMVEKIITCSEYKINHQFNETNISGPHQIVLNCLWLNVKASCELSSILIRYYKNDMFVDVCEKCLKLICNVLETSRHKGAIEAGGNALGLAIQHLTLLPASSMGSKIPMLLLKEKLKQLLLETSITASVTRRGAGLSIMIHRIVGNDMKKGKPLFHYFMQTLLETCNKLSEYCSIESGLDISDQKDLPQAIYIHFLTKIVTDSSLASDMMYYSDKLAKLAFDSLASSCWQIRNAALQLYGSLIPKIIGQKKNSGTSEEVIATVAVDEFRTHSPKLWEYMEAQLTLTTKLHYDVQCDNTLVPILSILANLAPFYSFDSDMDSKEKILSSLISLLGSSIYVVRRLTSKCIINIYPFEVVLDFLLSCTCKKENSLHGSLILLYVFYKQYNIGDMEEISPILKNKYDILMTRKCSYLSRQQFEMTYPECLYLSDKMVKETLSEIKIRGTIPGIFLWANFRIQLYLEKASWYEIKQIFTLISECSNFETYCNVLYKRIRNEKIIEEELLLDISISLYSIGIKKKSVIVWKTLYEISLHTQLLNKYLDTSLLYQYLLDNGVFYRMRYMIPFAARIYKDDACEELLYLSNIIFNLCYPETDTDMRLIAVTANNELATKFENLSDCIKINAIKAAIIFLQDEDEDVRNLSVHFYRIVNNDEVPTHPYICWRKILSHSFLNKILSNPDTGIQSICKDIMDVLKSLHIQNDDEYNPFANDSKNIYLEPQVLTQVINCLRTV